MNPNSIPLSSLNVRNSGQWYCAKDICSELGINWSGSTLKNLPDECRTLIAVLTCKGYRDAVFINAQGIAYFINKSSKTIAMDIEINTPYCLK